MTQLEERWKKGSWWLPMLLIAVVINTGFAALPDLSLGSTLRLTHSASRLELIVKNKAGTITNIGLLGLSVPNISVATQRQVGSNNIALEWTGNSNLQVTRLTTTDPEIECFDVSWKAESCAYQVLQDCFNLSYAHWYGGFEDNDQYWPMNRIQHEEQPYVTNDIFTRRYGDVIERLFLSSNGFGIFVDPEVPLNMRFNNKGDNLMCFSATYKPYPYFNDGTSLPFLKYQICQGPDVKAVYSYMSAKHIPKPTDIPNEALFRSAVWSTWALYKEGITQKLVLEYAKLIHQHGFPCIHIEVDDDWTVRYGDFDFTKQKFPDAKAMVAEITKLGYRTTVWLHPFFNLDSSAFHYANSKGYLVKARDSDAPAIVSWWRSTRSSTIIDTTNPEAVEWYLNSTRFLQTAYNISSFKFDAGETNWLPPLYSTKRPIKGPGEFSRSYVEMALRADPHQRAQEVRVGARSQDLPLLVRMLDRNTGWGYSRGIETLIPCVLTLGIIGYPFILPDMVGGNEYSGQHQDAELFIRWLQINTFLPTIQYSIGPWVFNQSVVDISKKFMTLRSKYTDKIVALARNATKTGAPIVRPLWWIAPTDKDALTAESQFLLGDDLLVAPVVKKGARSRDIYLPAGSWRDELRGGAVRKGPVWLVGYAAAIDELPYFQRV